MRLPDHRTRQARLIDSNLKSALNLLSIDKKMNEQCEYIFSNIPHPLFNCVLSTHSSINEIESLIEGIGNDYNSKSKPHCWWISECTEPAHLSQHLIKRGYVKGPVFSGMHAQIDTLSSHTDINPKILIKEVTKPEEIDDWVKPIQVSFEFSNEVSNAFANCYKELLLNDQRVKHFIAYYEGALAGSSTIFFDDDSAGLYNGGVFTNFRSLGVITNLALRMIAEIKERGYKDIVVQAAEIIRHLSIKSGFKEYIHYQAHFFNHQQSTILNPLSLQS